MPNEDKNIGGSLVLDLRISWRHVKTLKFKTKEPLKVLSPSVIRGTKFMPLYNFPAQ